MTHETDMNEDAEPSLDAYRESRELSNGAASREGSTPREVRVGRLDSLPALRNEMGRLYRAARRVAGANPTPSDATRLGWLLNALATAVTNSELADRVAALEAKHGRKP